MSIIKESQQIRKKKSISKIHSDDDDSLIYLPRILNYDSDDDSDNIWNVKFPIKILSFDNEDDATRIDGEGTTFGERSSNTRNDVVTIKETQSDAINAITFRHCFMYTPDASQGFSFNDKVDLNTPFKEAYNPSFKSTTNIHLINRKMLLIAVRAGVLYYTKYYKKVNKHPIFLCIGDSCEYSLTLAKMFPNAVFILYINNDIAVDYPKHFTLHRCDIGNIVVEECNASLHSINTDIGACDRSITNRLIFINDFNIINKRGVIDQEVRANLHKQMEYVKGIRPLISVLKFRMPYDMKHGDTFEYLRGTLYYNVWNPPTSGETRLIVEQKFIDKLTHYDFKKYEETLFFHNKYKRPFCYNTPYSRITNRPHNDYCACFDCTAELSILDQYAKLFDTYLEATIAYIAPNSLTETFNKSLHSSKKKRGIRINIPLVDISELIVRKMQK